MRSDGVRRSLEGGKDKAMQIPPVHDQRGEHPVLGTQQPAGQLTGPLPPQTLANPACEGGWDTTAADRLKQHTVLRKGRRVQVGLTSIWDQVMLGNLLTVHHNRSAVRAVGALFRWFRKSQHKVPNLNEYGSH